MKKLALIICFTFLANVSLGEGFSSGMPPAEEEALSAPYARHLSLEDCIRYAVNNSFEVKLARLDLYIAETDLMYSEAVFDAFLYGGVSYSEDKRQELSVFSPDNDQTNNYYVGVSKTLPTGTEIKAQFGDTRTWSDSAFVSKNPAHAAELRLEAIQPIGKNAFGYIDRKTITLTKLSIKNADLQMQDRIEALIADTEKAYWSFVSTKRTLEIFTRMLERAKELYESDKRNFETGLIERGDLFGSEANVARREAEVLVAENRYKTQEENLKLIMNAPDEMHIIPKDELKSDYEGKDIAGCLKEAFENRRDYMAGKRDIEIKGINLNIKKNEMWPEIDIYATMAMNGIEPEFKKAVGKTTVADNTYYYVGLEFTIPVENSAARSQLEKAGYEKESAIVSLKETERTIITEVSNAFSGVTSYKASLTYIKEAVLLQANKLKEEEKRFKYGRSSTKTIIDYQRDLLNAELEEAKFLLDYHQAQVDLARAMNSILEKYEDIL